MVLYHVANPQVETVYANYIRIRLNSGLLYPGVDYVVTRIDEIIKGESAPEAVILDMYGIHYIDFTAIIELVGVLKEMRAKMPTTEILITNVNLKVEDVLQKTELNEFITSQGYVSSKFGDEVVQNAYS